MQDLSQILLAAQSPDATARNSAEQQIASLEASDAGGFFQALSAHLSNESNALVERKLAGTSAYTPFVWKSVEIRSAFIPARHARLRRSHRVSPRHNTGLILKNALDSRDVAKKEQQAKRWLSLDSGSRTLTKHALLAGLGAAELDIGHTAALVVAKLAAIEIPKNLWPELIPGLLEGAAAKSVAGADPAAAGRRQSSIELLGYICEELALFEEDYLNEEMVNAILTGVVTAMNPEEASMDLRCVATKALTNALEFSANNFKREAERDYIMQMLCHGTTAADPRVREASWECLVRVAENFYECLPTYISAIFALTEKAMNDEVEGVMMQSLEFWSTVADEELEISFNVMDGKADSSHHFIETALDQLVPLLLAQLTKQEEIADEGTWNGALAAGAALSLAATVAKDRIVPIVMPYVQGNIQKKGSVEDWRFREAATFAFGCILDGPQPEALGDLARAGLEFMLNALTDENPLVKNTTAWCLGRIFEFVHGQLHPPLIDEGEQLERVVQTLLHSLGDELYIAEKVCYAISKLASGYANSDRSPMTKWFQLVVGKLLETSSRGASEVGQSNIQIQAFAAINEVVSASTADASPIIVQLTGVMTQNIASMVQVAPTSQEAAEQQLETLNLLCGVTSAIITKLYEAGARDVQSFDADSVMQALLAVFACREGYVPEEAMLAVGALTYVTGKDFGRYMQAFYPFLEQGLQQTREWQTCNITLGILSDICRALEEGFAPYCDRIMHILIRSLDDPEVPKAVKPSILGSFGDIAIAIEDNFVKYVGAAAPPLQAAAEMSIHMAKSVAPDDEDEIDYVNSLRQNILDAWSGMYNGLSKQAVNQHLKPFTESIIFYIQTIAEDKTHEDNNVLNRAVGVLGDAAANIEGIGMVFQQKPFVRAFLQHCQTIPGLDEKSEWSLRMVDAALAQS